MPADRPPRRLPLSAEESGIDITVVVPTYNRRERLRRCLEGFDRQDHDHGAFEVVVVDDGSDDGTHAMLDALEPSFALRVINAEHGGSSRARNIGIAAARGEFVINFDDDMVADGSLVRAHLEVQSRTGGCLGVGRIDLREQPGADWYADLTQRAWRAHYDRLEDGRRSPTWDTCYSGNLSAPRDALMAVGGFDEEQGHGDDIELGFRLHRRGLTVVYVPHATALHDDFKPCRRQLRELRAQGKAYVRIGQLHPVTRRTLLRSFRRGSGRERGVRRVAIALRVPPAALVPLHRAMPNPHLQRLWWDYVYRIAFWQGVRSAVDRPMWRRLTGGTPILMYHAFAREGERSSRYVVSARQLRMHLRLLRLLRRRVVPLEWLADSLAAGEPPPPRSVAITIDDGFKDVLDVAVPVLKAAGVPATMFMVTGYAGRPATWAIDAEPLRGRPIMTLADVRAVEASGVAIGAHTRSHPHLSTVGEHEARREMEGSRRDLEELLGHPVRTFAYPHGARSESVRALVPRTGYVCACSVRMGPNDLGTPLDELLRNEVMGTDSLWSVARAALMAPTHRRRRPWRPPALGRVRASAPAGR